MVGALLARRNASAPVVCQSHDWGCALGPWVVLVETAKTVDVLRREVENAVIRHERKIAGDRVLEANETGVFLQILSQAGAEVCGHWEPDLQTRPCLDSETLSGRDGSYSSFSSFCASHVGQNRDRSREIATAVGPEKTAAVDALPFPVLSCLVLHDCQSDRVRRPEDWDRDAAFWPNDLDLRLAAQDFFDASRLKQGMRQDATVRERQCCGGADLFLFPSQCQADLDAPNGQDDRILNLAQSPAEAPAAVAVVIGVSTDAVVGLDFDASIDGFDAVPDAVPLPSPVPLNYLMARDADF